MGFAPPFAKYIDLDPIFKNEDIFVYYVSLSVNARVVDKWVFQLKK